ncbi:hypothetical protein ABMA27_006088 [Loxostege sticticalis]|uniref:ascorbate ferrireductase (transmembrane) n=1 Tax=Loxostege sticticalis TaxID=481309 RepID=A0ABR3HHK0_LOXSC
MDGETSTEEIAIKEEESPEEEKVVKNYVLSKTVRLLLNLLTHVLMMITVFVCLVFACKSHVGIFELHIILCVIGYQFFMCQGALALAKYNVWSDYLRRLHRIHVHWVLEVIALAMVTAGSVMYLLKLPAHFTTLHGGFGLVALGATLLAVLCGAITGLSYAVQGCAPARKWFKYIHHTIAVIALLLSAISLSLAFMNPDFKLWTSKWFENNELPVPILMFITLLFTCSVAVEFLLVLWI